MPNLRRLGQEAEDRAAKFLLDLGYTIVTRRYKASHGEIDIIVLDEEILVFVEVKQRRAAGYIPEESVGRTKLAAMQSAARQYLEATGEVDRNCRFDLIAIDANGLRHHIDLLN